jgi:hypothetical protein
MQDGLNLRTAASGPMKRSIFSYIAIGTMLSSCSTPVQLADAQLAQAHYRDWSCSQLEEEWYRLGNRAIKINDPTTVAEVAGLAGLIAFPRQRYS